MTGWDYMENVCPTTSKGKDPNREDVADAFDDGIAEYYKTRWKPSDEQIQALNMVITDKAMDDNVKTILKELIIQIKKL